MFVRDLQAQTTTLASRATGAAGAAAAGISSAPSISADGRHVVFGSSATNLSADDVASQGIYRRDLQAHVTTLVSRRSTSEGGGAANGSASAPRVSGDGRHVAFSSTATNLSALVDGGQGHVYVRDVQAQTTTLTDRQGLADGGAGGNQQAFAPALSDNGRVVAFTSLATNLLPALGLTGSHVYRAELPAPAQDPATTPTTESPAPPATQPPVPGTPAKPKPATRPKGCVSRRWVDVRLRARASRVRITITARGKVVRTRTVRKPGRTVRVPLAGLPDGRYRVRIVAVTKRGTTTITRTWLTCQRARR